MSEIKALEKLREFVGKELYEKERIGHGDYSHLHVLIEDVKREIAERYMKLPVDADGVPIRMGDDMANEEIGPLRVLGVFGTGFIWVDDAGECFEASLLGRSKYHHANPDPIKVLLEELVAKVENDVNWRCNASDEIDCMTARIREAVEK